MSKQKLVLKYHPAKKEVEFHRFQNAKEIPIRSDSRLMQYMNMKGKFVLQDFGNSFFNDIARVFDGLKSVDIEVITTKLDYEDFAQMAEYYNTDPDNDCKINPILCAELPDMKQTFRAAVKHGEDAIVMLEEHKKKLFEISLKDVNVKKVAEDFAQEIDNEIKNIKEKIASLKDNNVSLCFTGVYSAGKSALINAILGYKILPEDIQSKTAKMFQISSPREGDSVKIIFRLKNTYTEIVWDDKDKCLEFAKGPSENSVRTDIQCTINNNKESRQHEQIEALLEKLNGYSEVSSSIQVEFPMPLDSENVQFTIYDTPGTDSDNSEHLSILKGALENQRQSILIFVIKPDGVEGGGNDILLRYLKEAEEKSKTSIDLGRSLFVINKADTINAKARKELYKEEIKIKDEKSDVNFLIELSNKKLFFTSAINAYAARAVANGIATEAEQWEVDKGESHDLVSSRSLKSYCYRQNRCATSEFATEKMIKRCETALKEANKEDDNIKVLEVCSGLYALENEIKIYGEKYASAVKAFAIVDSVDKALSKLNKEADSLKNDNAKKVSDIEEEIKQLRETIERVIDTAYNETVFPDNESLPEKIRLELGTDSDALQAFVIRKAKQSLDGALQGWFFGHGKVRFDTEDKDMVIKKIGQVIDDFTNRFLKKRTELLQENRDIFMGSVKQAIIDNGKISDSAKNVVLDIPEPKIDMPDDIVKLGDIYVSHKRIDKVLWFEQETLDKDGFLKEIEQKLIIIAMNMVDDYEKDYRDALVTLLEQIKSEFRNNLDRYSQRMKVMIDNREAMKNLGGKISDAAASLVECQELLNKVIWEELGNGR